MFDLGRRRSALAAASRFGMRRLSAARRQIPIPNKEGLTTSRTSKRTMLVSPPLPMPSIAIKIQAIVAPARRPPPIPRPARRAVSESSAIRESDAKAVEVAKRRSMERQPQNVMTPSTSNARPTMGPLPKRTRKAVRSKSGRRSQDARIRTLWEMKAATNSPIKPEIPSENLFMLRQDRAARPNDGQRPAPSIAPRRSRATHRCATACRATALEWP